MRRMRLVAGLLSLLVIAAACGDDGGDGGGNGGGGGGGDDLLSLIQDRGTIIASTDPAYPPQSSQNKEGEFEGFDIDVINEIADRLGVEVEYETPPFDAITGGSWSGRWDMSVGSITITPERQEVLEFTPPYYYTPASAAVHEDNTDITDVTTDLDGKKIGVCQECSYQLFLEKKLKIPGEEFDFVVDDADVKVYNTDTTAIQDLALGDGDRLDAVMSALPTLDNAAKEGQPIKVVGDPLFYEPLGIAFDKDSPIDNSSLVEEVTRIVEEMHADGTLTEFSKKWYDGIDLTKKQ